MPEWIHTSWENQENVTTFVDENDCWWHRFKAKLSRSRIRRLAGEAFERSREWGRRPYIDGSNWGLKSQTEKRSRDLAQERGIRQERRKRGKKI